MENDIHETIQRAFEQSIPLILVIGASPSEANKFVFQSLLPKEKKKTRPEILFVNQSSSSPTENSDERRFINHELSTFVTNYKDKRLLVGKFDLVFVTESAAIHDLSITVPFLHQLGEFLKEEEEGKATSKFIVPNFIVREQQPLFHVSGNPLYFYRDANQKMHKFNHQVLDFSSEHVLPPLIAYPSYKLDPTTKQKHFEGLLPAVENYVDQFQDWASSALSSSSSVELTYRANSDDNHCPIVSNISSHKLCFYIEGKKKVLTEIEAVRKRLDDCHQKNSSTRTILILGAVPSEEPKFNFTKHFPGQETCLFFVDNCVFSGTCFKEQQVFWKGRLIKEDIEMLVSQHGSFLQKSFDLIVTDTGVGHHFKLTFELIMDYLQLLKPSGRIVLNYCKNEVRSADGAMFLPNSNKKQFHWSYNGVGWFQQEELKEPFEEVMPLQEYIRLYRKREPTPDDARKFTVSYDFFYTNYNRYLNNWFDSYWNSQDSDRFRERELLRPSIQFMQSKFDLGEKDFLGFIEIKPSSQSVFTRRPLKGGKNKFFSKRKNKKKKITRSKEIRRKNRLSSSVYSFYKKRKF